MGFRGRSPPGGVWGLHPQKTQRPKDVEPQRPYSNSATMVGGPGAKPAGRGLGVAPPKTWRVSKVSALREQGAPTNERTTGLEPATLTLAR